MFRKLLALLIVAAAPCAAAQDYPGFSRPRLNYEPNSPRLLVESIKSVGPA